MSANPDPADVPGIEVATYRGVTDGAAVVEIDTSNHDGVVRVYVNEGTVFNADPEVASPRSRVYDAVLTALDAVEAIHKTPTVADYTAALRGLVVSPRTAPRAPLFVVPAPSTAEGV